MRSLFGNIWFTVEAYRRVRHVLPGGDSFLEAMDAGGFLGSPAGSDGTVNLYFALDDLSPEELAKASFMAQLFGCLDTAKYSLADLSPAPKQESGRGSSAPVPSATAGR